VSILHGILALLVLLAIAFLFSDAKTKIQLLYYLRVIKYVAWGVGGAIRWLLRTTRIESFFASVVIFLGQSEAPMTIARCCRGSVARNCSR
jgi:concentrative nucleoside transporter, CNT family